MCTKTYQHLCYFHTLPRVWAISGEGVDMGEEASQWISQYLGLDGCRLYYMAPRHRARVLRQDQRWEDIARHGEEVINCCT